MAAACSAPCRRREHWPRGWPAGPHGSQPSDRPRTRYLLREGARTFARRYRSALINTTVVSFAKWKGRVMNRQGKTMRLPGLTVLAFVVVTFTYVVMLNPPGISVSSHDVVDY